MTTVFADTYYLLALVNANDLTEALTKDHHFEQAGYIALLK